MENREERKLAKMKGVGGWRENGQERRWQEKITSTLRGMMKPGAKVASERDFRRYLEGHEIVDAKACFLFANERNMSLLNLPN